MTYPGEFGEVIEVKPLPDEFVLRELPRLDLDDISTVKTLLEMGMIDRRIDPSWRSHGAPSVPRPRPPDSIHVREVSFFLKLARALALHWVQVQRGLPTIEPWKAETESRGVVGFEV